MSLMGLTRYRLAKEIGVPAPRIGEIVRGKRSVTAATDLRLCRFFGLTDGYWLRAGCVRHRGCPARARRGAGKDQAKGGPSGLTRKACEADAVLRPVGGVCGERFGIFRQNGHAGKGAWIGRGVVS